jgi:hypothetical protein
MDLRRRVIAACDAGQGTTSVATTFNVSPAWVRRLKQQRRERGDIHYIIVSLIWEKLHSS